VAVDTKDKKYLSNVEKSIVKNNLAIVRWQRAEAESDYLDSRYGPPRPHLTHSSLQSSKEIRWIGHLVPYATRPNAQPWNQQLLLDNPQHDPSNPKNEASVEVLNTVNLLLAKWTTLNIRNEDRAGTATRDTNTERAKKSGAEKTGNRSFHGKIVPVGVKETTAGEEQHRKERILENDAPLSPGSTSNVIKREYAGELPDVSPSTNPSRSAEGPRPDISYPTMPGYIETTFNSRHQADSNQAQDGQAPDQITTAATVDDKIEIGNGMGGRSIVSDDDRSEDKSKSKDDYAHSEKPYPTELDSTPYVSSNDSGSGDSYNYLPAEPVSQRSSPRNSRARNMPERPAPVSTPSVGPADTEFRPFHYDPRRMHSFGHGPQPGFAQTVIDPGSSANYMVPYGPMPPSQNPYVPPPFAQPYPGVSPYGVHIPAPPVSPSSDTAKAAERKTVEGRDQDEALKRLEAMIMREREERAKRAAEEAQIAAEKAKAEREAVLREAKEEAARAKMEIKRLEAEATARAKHEAEVAAKAKYEAEAAARAKREEEAKSAAKESGSIKFKDAIGRRYTFPLKLCRTWDVSFTHSHFAKAANA
jgi:hypothetical protein